ncbi:MAG: hypothetical protein EBX50_09570 [Chitinophagia bacterium]|nr:hypothetical protein [Chitinophagia bacterium]
MKEYIKPYAAPDIPLGLYNKLVSYLCTQLLDRTLEQNMYCFMEETDRTTINYVDSSDKWLQEHGPSCGVVVYGIAEQLQEEIRNTYKDDSWLGNCRYEFTTLIGGDYIAPHHDGTLAYTADGYVVHALIIPGSDNTITRYYTPKDKFSHLKIIPDTGIPYDKLDAVQDYKLEIRKWVHFSPQQIHSVHNINSFRALLLSKPR